MSRDAEMGWILASLDGPDPAAFVLAGPADPAVTTGTEPIGVLMRQRGTVTFGVQAATEGRHG